MTWENNSPKFNALLHRPLVWLIVAMLFGYASDGVLWFRTGAGSSLGSAYGTLATGKSGTTDTALMLLGIGVPAVILGLRKWKALVRTARHNSLLGLLPLWVIASVAWSQYPLVTLEWAPTVAIGYIFAVYLATEFNSQTLMRIVLLLGALCLGATVVASLAFGYTDVEGGWRGIYQQKNMCCMNTEFLLTPALFAGELGRGSILRLFRVGYILLSIVVIVETKSSTGLIVLPLLLGFAALLELLRHFKKRDRRLLLLTCGGASLFVLTVMLTSFADLAVFLGKDPSLTGRTEIWKAMAVSIAKRPLLGYGYRAFWRGYEGESALVSLQAHWAVPSAHNAFLEILITLGLVGLIVIALVCLKAIRDCFQCTLFLDSPFVRWYVSLIALMLMNSFDESEMLVPFGITWLLFMLAAINLAGESLRLRRGIREEALQPQFSGQRFPSAPDNAAPAF